MLMSLIYSFYSDSGSEYVLSASEESVDLGLSDDRDSGERKSE